MSELESKIMEWYDVRFVSQGDRLPPLAKVIGKPYLIINRTSSQFELTICRLYLEYIYQEL